MNKNKDIFHLIPIPFQKYIATFTTALRFTISSLHSVFISEGITKDCELSSVCQNTAPREMPSLLDALHKDESTTSFCHRLPILKYSFPSQDVRNRMDAHQQAADIPLLKTRLARNDSSLLSAIPCMCSS